MSSIAERMAARQQQAGGPSALDTLLGSVPKTLDSNSVRNIPINLLHPFSKHTFKIREGTPELEALIQSVKSKGIAQPLIVRSRMQGEYEIIAGHTRCYAAKKAGLSEVPAILHECSDDEAIELMAETNKQRESWLPSERAKTYALWWETIQKRQGQRSDLTCGTGFHKLNDAPDGTCVNGLHKLSDASDGTCGNDFHKLSDASDGTCGNDFHKLSDASDGTCVTGLHKLKSRDQAGEYWGVTGKAFQMYLKLNNLIPNLLTYTDDGRIAFAAAYEIAFLNPVEQRCVAEFLDQYEKKKISRAKGREIRQALEQNRPKAPAVELVERCMGIGTTTEAPEQLSVHLPLAFNKNDLKPKAIKRALEDDAVCEKVWAIIEEWVNTNY